VCRQELQKRRSETTGALTLAVPMICEHLMLPAEAQKHRRGAGVAHMPLA